MPSHASGDRRAWDYCAGSSPSDVDQRFHAHTLRRLQEYVMSLHLDIVQHVCRGRTRGSQRLDFIRDLTAAKSLFKRPSTPASIHKSAISRPIESCIGSPSLLPIHHCLLSITLISETLLSSQHAFLPPARRTPCLATAPALPYTTRQR